MKNFLPSENANMNRLCLFVVISMIELLLLAIAVRIYDDGREFRNVINIFLSIMGGIVFLIDGILGKNIIQVKNYPRILIYSVLLIIIAAKKATRTATALFSGCLSLIALEIIIIWSIYRNLELEYKWYNYKKHGLSENLQYARIIGQRLLVYYKVDAVVTVTSVLNPRTRQIFPLFLNINLIALILTTYCYLGWNDTESYINRFFIIAIYIIKMVSDTVYLTKYFTTQNDISNIIPFRLIYILINDSLFVATLMIEISLFGQGYYEKLYKNKREEKRELE